MGEEEDGMEEEKVLGDIIINLYRAVEQAEEFGHSKEREMAYLSVHGFLHILGYDHYDPEEKRKMREKEEEILGACGMERIVKGVFNATRAASECMIAKGQGVILSTSSMVSIYGQPSGFAYPASKFAVNGLTVSLARELGPKGIRVNAVAPGITLTDMMKAVPKEVIDPLIKQIPLRRLGQPEDIANAFVFLASDEASYITGVVLSVDGMART